MKQPVTVTMVFEIEPEVWLASNPFKVETPWGKPVAIGLGNALDEEDELNQPFVQREDT